MRTVVIVQARLGSTRLPGKVLMELAGQSVLRHVLERCAAIPGIDAVCCAVPIGKADDPVALQAAHCGAIVTRGSETDVLERYYQASIETNADIVMRVTSDCPLIDPYQAGDVLSLVAGQGADYSCNNMPRSWPHGLDCEAFTSAWLARAATEATSPYDREHVTPYIRNHPGAHKRVLHGPGGSIAEQRWTLDTEADLIYLRKLFAKLPMGPASYDYRVPLGVSDVQ